MNDIEYLTDLITSGWARSVAAYRARQQEQLDAVAEQEEEYYEDFVRDTEEDSHEAFESYVHGMEEYSSQHEEIAYANSACYSTCNYTPENEYQKLGR